MEPIWNQVFERLSNPEVLFGLAVRFFGVFVVLIIVMIVLYLTGWFFQRIEEKAQEAASAAHKGGPPPPRTPTNRSAKAVGTPSGSDVPGEVAAAVALSMVPDEVAVAVALALTETAKERGVATRFPAQAGVPAPWEEPGAAWKIVGRQEALFRSTSLRRYITSKGE